MSNQKVYDYVFERIQTEMEKGIIPWRKPWGTDGNGDLPRNGTSGKHYNGINLLMLDWGHKYYTMKQIGQKGWRIKKGSKGFFVVYFELKEIASNKEGRKGEMEKIPFLRYYYVFKDSDIEGCPTSTEATKTEHQPIEEAEKVVSAYEIEIKHDDSKGAYYSPVKDSINVPDRSRFVNIEEFYSTCFHEMTHSTGHEKRLKRTFGNHFGDEQYSKEELIAEIGAGFLCGKCGIEQKTLENSVAYIQNWLGALSKDKKMIVQAAAAASKAADYIIGE
jgi:antirestriction protein ArdC